MQKTTILQQTMQILIIFLIKRKKRKKAKKMHSQVNEFKCLEKTFTNNGV